MATTAHPVTGISRTHPRGCPAPDGQGPSAAELRRSAPARIVTGMDQDALLRKYVAGPLGGLSDGGP